ncbi:MAG: TetR/AcrR family transcriptional regulator [Acidimicrobiales bacterium]|nr:MAG: TetR/AcrR family transcriptional regulator [Acidimicrobiales bacterium]
MSNGWETRQQRTRSEILAAVGDIIATEGVDGLTMRKLAERANVAVATLYNQFDDRNGVLVAFVSHGLDELELSLDEQPASDPVDGTRVLLSALDDTIGSADHVWRPVLATIGASPGSQRMGAVGDRIIATIEIDLAKARAAGMFFVECDTDRLARHVFVQWMRGLERWAHGTIDWATHRANAELGLELALAAVLVEPHRTDALRRAGILG